MTEIKWVEVDGVLKPQWDFPSPPFPRNFYENLRSARPSFRLVERSVIPVAETGRAVRMKSGQSLRIVCVEGPQIADVCFWNANDPREHFWNDGTLTREGERVTTFTRLWSTLPNYRPMMTVIEDTVPPRPDSAAHTCLSGYCDPHYWYWALKDKDHPYVTTFNCYFNLLRAARKFGLDAGDIHDNVNLFMRTYFTDDGKQVVDVSDVRQGDYIEFYAEMDVLVAISICPDGSGNLPYDTLEQDIKPLGIEIYETSIQPLPFENVLEEIFARGPSGQS